MPPGCEHVPETPDPSWVSRHVQQSRYALQVVKCDDRECCEMFKTDWEKVFPERFVPFPAVYSIGTNGIIAVEPSSYFKNLKKFEFASLQKRVLLKKIPEEGKKYDKIIPFDLYCPSMEDKIKPGICPICCTYWPSAAAMLRHKKCHGKRKRTRRIRKLSSSEEEEEPSSGNDTVYEKKIVRSFI